MSVQVKDPYQSVFLGREGTGAAYIHKDDVFTPRLLASMAPVLMMTGRKKRQREEKAKNLEELVKTKLEGWQIRDGNMLGRMTEEIIKEGAKYVAAGHNPFNDEHFVIQMKKASLIADMSKEHETIYKDLFDKTWQAYKDGTLNEDEAEINFSLLEQFASKTPLERSAADLEGIIPPRKPKEEFDFYEPLKKIKVGYIERRDLDRYGVGKEIRKPMLNELKKNVERFLEYNPKYYNEGVKAGLWKSKEEAADAVFNIKFWETDFSIKDIANYAYSSFGYSEKEIEEDFRKWKEDLYSGNEEAAAYLFDVKLPSGETIKKVKQLQKAGYSTPGIAYDYITEFPSVTKEGNKIIIENNFEFFPNDYQDNELYRLYLKGFQERKRTYQKGIQFKDEYVGGKKKLYDFETKPKTLKPKPY